MPSPYREIILFSSASPRYVWRFFTSSGSKLLLRSRGVESSNALCSVFTVFVDLPFLRLFVPFSLSSPRCACISPWSAASSICLINGVSTPCLPLNGLPRFSSLMALSWNKGKIEILQCSLLCFFLSHVNPPFSNSACGNVNNSIFSELLKYC